MKITRYRGDTLPLSVTIRNDTQNQAADLTGCTVKFTADARANPADDITNVFQLTGTNGEFRGEVLFDWTDTAADNVGMFYYDIEITFPDAVKVTVAKGIIEFVQDITK